MNELKKTLSETESKIKDAERELAEKKRKEEEAVSQAAATAKAKKESAKRVLE